MEKDGPRARFATHGSLHSALLTWGSPSAATGYFLDEDGWKKMGREQGLPHMAPYTPPGLRVDFPPQQLAILKWRWMEKDGPRARFATHGSLRSALPTWGSPSAATGLFLDRAGWKHMDREQGLPCNGSLHSALPTWGPPSAATIGRTNSRNTQICSMFEPQCFCKCKWCRQHNVQTGLQTCQGNMAGRLAKLAKQSKHARVTRMQKQACQTCQQNLQISLCKD